MNLDFSSETSNSMFGKSYRGASAKLNLGVKHLLVTAVGAAAEHMARKASNFASVLSKCRRNGQNSGGCSVESPCMFLGTFQIGFLLT
jgi:hypothetical protein